MRIVCVWRDNTEYARQVSEWLRNFEMETNVQVESIDPDSIEGQSFTSAHDVVEYPTILVLDNRGSELQIWRGLPLPGFKEVSYYSRTV